MDKKSIIGIAVVAVLFLGFAYFNSQQQKEYLEQKKAELEVFSAKDC
jgi:YidC/Oxa1 family membrane protein insertase